MVKVSSRRGKTQNEETGIEEFGMDEVDEFAHKRDQELMEKAGLNKRHDDEGDSDDEEAVEGVMDIDSDAEIEKYKRKFQGPIDESDEEYFKDGDNNEEEDSDLEKNHWGGDYYGADEAEDEEDERLMEEEALRLQKQHMADLNMEDFMLDEVEDWRSEKKVEEEQDEKEDKLEEILISGDKKSRLEIIKKKYPEYLPLVTELRQLNPVYEQLKLEIEGSNIKMIQFKALSVYLGSIVSYMTIFANKLSKDEPFEMKDEDVMVSILSGRELWRQASGLLEERAGKSDEEEEEEEGKAFDNGGLSNHEEEEEEEEEEEDEDDEDDDDEDEEDDEHEDPKTESEDKYNEAPSFESLRKIKKLSSKNLEDMDEIDAEDKKGRRQNLRFYTSKLDKRDIGKVHVDGDMDAAYENDGKQVRRDFKTKDKRGGRKGGRKGRK
ncbi:uncharacterized protein C5L36_0B06600 [Pichia kudriavzevii]|uniref:Sas10 C-terminal domain-containing protein n=1 Tax=Pichia kudriavzevii TaxID=4909 RepID=A0A2U9R282_PICKU|nr:uncharacterized protein C5L36_0B06600 [Pichia kudriavzevii]AWU75415.1 hypothetical protein C5L36_0B06600 [Pichia kudriavzevii]